MKMSQGIELGILYGIHLFITAQRKLLKFLRLYWWWFLEEKASMEIRMMIFGGLKYRGSVKT